MPDLTQEELAGVLKDVASNLIKAKLEVATVEAEWYRTAASCKYSQTGFWEKYSDTLECAFIGEGSSDDPFCYSDNCPLLK